MNWKHLSAIVMFVLLLPIVSMAPSAGASTSTASSSTNQTPKSGGTLVIGIASNPITFNPAITTSVDLQISSQIYMAPVRLNDNMTPEPYLAQSWSTSPNGLTVTLNLVHNATWTDGVPVTAADVVYSYTKILPEYNPLGKTVFGDVTNITAPNNYTVVIQLAKPFPSFISLLTVSSGAVLPEHIYEGQDPLNCTCNMNPIGDGPFMFKSYTPDQSVILVRNPNYYLSGEGKPYLNEIIYEVITDPTAMANALITGQIDYISSVNMPYASLSQIQAAATSTGLGFMTAPPAKMSMTELDFNLRNPIVSNQLVRQAIATALNTTYIAYVSSYGGDKQALGPWPSWWMNFNPNLPTYPYNVTKAEQMLTQAGYPPQANGTRFSLNMPYFTGYYEYATAAQTVAAELLQVGINVILTPQDLATWQTTVFTNYDFDMIVRPNNVAPIPDISGAKVWTGAYISHVPYTNEMGFNNSIVNADFLEAPYTNNATLRQQLDYQIQDIINTQLPSIPLFQREFGAVYNEQFVFPQQYFPDQSNDPYDVAWYVNGTPLVISSSTTSSTSTTSTTPTTSTTTTPTTSSSTTATTTSSSTTATTTTTSSTTSSTTALSYYILPVLAIAAAVIMVTGALGFSRRRSGTAFVPLRKTYTS